MLETNSLKNPPFFPIFENSLCYQLIEFRILGDERGALVSLEGNINIPFDIKRVYYIYDTQPNVVRGKHSHKTLEQVLICLNGSCKISLDDGKYSTTIELNRPNQGLYIKSNIWREMSHFAHGTVLMVLANQIYDEKDYIRNYECFLKSKEAIS